MGAPLRPAIAAGEPAGGVAAAAPEGARKEPRPRPGARRSNFDQGPHFDDAMRDGAGDAGDHVDRCSQVHGLDDREAGDGQGRLQEGTLDRLQTAPSGFLTWTGEPAIPRSAPAAAKVASWAWAASRTAGAVRA
jgi:hypothetical protein